MGQGRAAETACSDCRITLERGEMNRWCLGADKQERLCTEFSSRAICPQDVAEEGKLARFQPGLDIYMANKNIQSYNS